MTIATRILGGPFLPSRFNCDDGDGLMDSGIRQIPAPIKFEIDIPIAELAISADGFAERFGVEFSEFFDEGIGPEKGAALQTPDGIQFCVISCGGHSGHSKHVYIVMEGATLDPYGVLGNILRSLNLHDDEGVTINHSAVKWAKDQMQKRSLHPRPASSP
jgi:hypothetical protein